MTYGKIILLNGASSAGKSTLARAIRAQAEVPFWHISSDQFVESDMLAGRKAEGGPFAWTVQRPMFFQAFHRCLPAIASTGNNIVIDHVIEFDTWLRELVVLLAAYDVFFVGVRCPLAELERRERERGDRMLGEAHDHDLVVHTFGPYDLEIDSPAATPEDHAAHILAAWQARATPSAFQRMRDA